MFGTVTIARVEGGDDPETARLPVPRLTMTREMALRWADLAEIHQPALAAQVRAVCAAKGEPA